MKISPTVTIAIPAYNEAENIRSILAGFINQVFPDLIEILVADGGSTDGTQDIVLGVAQDHPIVKLIHNPDKIQSCALNTMLKVARGDIFLRADAHSKYAENYIQACVDALLKSNAINVGGSQRYIASTPFQAGISLASKTPLTGSAKYLNTTFSGYADTVYLGCFWREKLLQLTSEYDYEEIFDTSQVTNQDAELNLKIIETFPEGVFISSEIKVWYFPRKSLGALIKQYLKFGRGRFLTFSKHPGASPLRSKIPTLFFITIFILTILLIFIFRLYFWTVIAYGLMLLIPLFETIRLAITYGDTLETEIWKGNSKSELNIFLVALYCFTAILFMPISFSAGYIYQFFRCKLTGYINW